MALHNYDFDLMMYDENCNSLDPKQFRSVHRIDYWSGYYSNKGSHKALIKAGFHKWMVARNLLELATLTRCHDVRPSELGDIDDLQIANEQFYAKYCTVSARSSYE